MSEKEGTRRTSNERRKLITDIRELIGQNYSDEEILEKLGIAQHILTEYKAHILAVDRAIFTKLDAATIFSDYVMKVRQVVRDLDDAIETCRNKSHAQALVTAIWKKKEAFDSVLKWSQELGFVKKSASELRLSSELSIGSMTEEDVRKEIEAELKRLTALSSGGVEMREEVFGLLPPEAQDSLKENIIPISKSTKSAKPKTKLKFILRAGTR
jgi:hypothetical protein